MGRGRPKIGEEKYSEDLIVEICKRLSEGETLRKISTDNDISWRTVYDWMESKPGLRERIAIARDLGYDAIFEDTLRIADTPLIGEANTVKHTVKGVETEVTKQDMLGHRKLQIWTRLQLLAKWNPKKYGDKVIHAGDAENPVKLVLQGSDIQG
jgi:hypothetical protein